MTSARPARRLSKRAVESLLNTYDDDPIGALETALRYLCDRPNATFDELVDDLHERGTLNTTRQRALLDRSVAALDALAAELNETRQLPS